MGLTHQGRFHLHYTHHGPAYNINVRAGISES